VTHAAKEHSVTAPHVAEVENSLAKSVNHFTVEIDGRAREWQSE
jgi:hypothetical protein